MAPSKCLICTRYVHKSNKQVQCLVCSERVHAECIGGTNSSVYIYYCNHCISDALPFVNECSTDQRSARAGFCRPDPDRRPHGPARGPELSLGPGPFRPVAWPSPARPGPVRSGPTKAVSMGFLETIQFN